MAFRINKTYSVNKKSPKHYYSVNTDDEKRDYPVKTSTNKYIKKQPKGHSIHQTIYSEIDNY